MAFLNPQDAAFVRKRFAEELTQDVRLEFFAPSTSGLTLPGAGGENAEYARQILAEVASLSDKITLTVHGTLTEPEVAQRYGVIRTPATAIVGAEDYGIRFYGMPAGYEFATLLELIIHVSQGTAPISQESRGILARLKENAYIQVFVTPT